MSVYVDNARIPARIGRITARWSHLTADTRPELYAFATGIGLRREWLQVCKNRVGCTIAEDCVHRHFDVTDAKRAQAIAAGAVEMDLRQWQGIIQARRTELGGAS